MNQKSSINFRKLLSLLKGHQTVLTLGTISMVAYVTCWPLLAWLSGKLISAIGKGDTSQVLKLICQALFVFIIQMLNSKFLFPVFFKLIKISHKYSFNFF